MKMAMAALAILLATMALPSQGAQARLRRSQSQSSTVKDLVFKIVNSTFAVDSEAEADADEPDTDEPEPVSNFENLEDHILKMARSKHSAAMDEGLKEVEKLIVGTLLPQINSTSAAAQKELDGLVKAFDACASPSSEKGELKLLGDARPPKVESHKACRVVEEGAWGEDNECKTVLNSLKQTMDASCGALEAIKRNPVDAKSQCNPAPGMEYGDWLDSNAKWFTEQQSKYKDLDSKCKLATSNYNAKLPVCTGKATALKNQRAACNLKQTALEDSFCSFQAGVVSACKNYGACFDASMKKYSERRPVIAKEETARKVGWNALKRIVCLLEVLAKDGAADDIEKCRADEKEEVTKHLDLKYTDAPKEELCAALGPMPCGKDFAAAVYGALPAHAVAAECSVCPGGAPPVFPNYEVAVASATEICAAGQVFEYNQAWDCGGQDIISIAVPAFGQSGWHRAFDGCASECAKRDNCASFNYPSPGNGQCWIKFAFRKSPSRGWSCGGSNSDWKFFTKIPGHSCKSPPEDADWIIPSGIQQNYAFSNLPKGWVATYDVPYATPSVWENIDPGQGDCMAIGSKTNAASTSFSVVAFGKRAAVINSGHGVWENNVFFYRVPSMSAGFADTNTIALNQADTMNMNSPLRLSWHLNLNAGGWRSGSSCGLNGDPTWRKIVMYGPCLS